MKIRRKGKEAALEELTIESGENAIANKEVEGLTQWQIIRRRFFKHKAFSPDSIVSSSRAASLLFLPIFTFHSQHEFLGQGLSKEDLRLS